VETQIPLTEHGLLVSAKLQRYSPRVDLRGSTDGRESRCECLLLGCPAVKPHSVRKMTGVAASTQENTVV
jgi:hypothetical protein